MEITSIFIDLFKFIILILVLFLPIGFLSLSLTHFKFNPLEKISLSFPIGFALFTLFSYFLKLTHLNMALLPLAVIIFIISLKPVLNTFQKIARPPKQITYLFLTILIIGVIFQLLNIAPSALQTNSLSFYSSHGHDAAWHIALMNEIQRGFPIQNPILLGERLFNYHFFTDISSADFNQILQISKVELYFRLFPLFYSICFGIVLYLAGKVIFNSNSIGLWSMIMGYFVGSFGYLISIPRNHNLNGETVFGSSQIQSSIGNPPEIAALIIFLASLILISKFSEEKVKNLILPTLITGLVIATLSGFKIYASVVLIPSLIVLAFLRLILSHKLDYFLTAIVAGTFSALIFLPNTHQAASFLIFQPLWHVQTMIVASDRLNWLDLELRRQTYLYYHNWKWVVAIPTFALVIFVIGNLGVRIIGFFELAKRIIHPNIRKSPISFLIVTITLISIIIPLLFIQSGVAGNSIQFMQYFLLLIGLLTAITLAEITQKIKPTTLKIIFIALIIILAIPTQIGLTLSFYSRPPLATISQSELQALQFLSDKYSSPKSILTAPYNRYSNSKISPTPIWEWFDTAYIPAFSKQRTFLSDSEQADILGYNIKSRQKLQELAFQTEDPIILNNILSKNNIDLIYFPKFETPKIDLQKINLTPIYANKEVEIWQVNH